MTWNRVVIAFGATLMMIGCGSDPEPVNTPAPDVPTENIDTVPDDGRSEAIGDRYGESYEIQYILIEEGSDATLATLEQKVKAFYKDSERTVETKLDGDLLTVNINGWEMYFEDRSGTVVADKVAELVAEYGNDAMDNEVLLGCKRMFVMSQLNDNYMEYFNETQYASHMLVEFSGVHICTPEHGFTSDF